MTDSLNIINVGLASFADAVQVAGGNAVNLDWRPPADGDVATGKALAQVVNNPAIEAANQIVFEKYLQLQNMLLP